MNVLWKNAGKQAVVSVTSVIIINLADAQTARFSWPWFKHMLIAMAVLTAVNEARYWNQWAGGDGGNDSDGQGGLMQAKLGKLGGTAVVLLVAMLTVAGCNTYQAALNAVNTAGQIFTIAQQDLPALEASGVIPAKDVPAVTGWLNAGIALQGQAKTCVTAAGTSGTKAALGNCLFVFANGLVSPTELANLRLLDKNTQQKVELWATAAVLAADGYCVIEGCTQASPPVITQAAPTAEELHNLRVEAGIPNAYGY
jgi:hypothetical protein